MGEDFYNTLGVKQNASQDEIKKAFRKMAVEHHPDKGGDEVVFKKINEAYHTLSDPQKRHGYDNKSNDPFHQFQHGGGGGGVHGFQGDFMNMFFRQQRGGGEENNSKEIRQTLQVELSDVYKASNKSISIVVEKVCKDCSSECSKCHGSGIVEKTVTKTMGNTRFVQIMKEKCDTCSGKGSIISKSKCEKCDGTRLIKSTTNITINLPERTFHDFIARVKHPEEKDTFIIIKVIVKFPPNFHKNGDNLYYLYKIDLIDSILGKKIEIPHPSGETIRIDYTKRSDIIKPDTVLNIENKGIVHNSDLVVKFDIQYPAKRHVYSDDRKDTFTSIRDNFEQILTK